MSMSEVELKMFEEQLESYGVVIHLGDRGYVGDVKKLTAEIRRLQSELAKMGERIMGAERSNDELGKRAIDLEQEVALGMSYISP